MSRTGLLEAPKISSVAKYHAMLWHAAGSVSTKLSIAVVVGLALVPLAARDAPARARAAAIPTKAEPVLAKAEPVRAKPDPVFAKPDPAADARSAAAGQLAEAEPSDSLLQLAAAKRRAKQAKRDEDPKRSASAIATTESERRPSAVATAETPGKAPVPSSEAKPDAEVVEPPKPDVWSDAEVIAALKECVRLLGPIAADVEVSAPVKNDQCGTPAPVMLRRIGSGANKVEINPPAMVNCAMVAGLHSWVEKTLQPAAQEAFGSPIARLRSASGYACRHRNGSLHNSDKLSEHAKANAVDIAGFVTADGRSVEVARHWGPTARDIREAERQAALRAKEAKEAKATKEAKAEPAKAEPTRSSSAIATRPEGRQKDKSGQGRSSADAKAVPLPPSAAASDPVKIAAEAEFLRRLHRGACGVFGTVLGPEANEAHRDHFHFDLAPRRRNAFCE